MEVVELNTAELLNAGLVGVARTMETIRKNLQGVAGEGPPSIEKNALGAMAELAYGKMTGMYWPATVNNFKGPDIGKRTQVRHTPLSGGRLIFRPERDSAEDYFVLVVGQLPRFWFVGGIDGKDITRDEWIDAPSERPPAYFVPQSALDPNGHEDGIDAPTAPE